MVLLGVSLGGPGDELLHVGHLKARVGAGLRLVEVLVLLDPVPVERVGDGHVTLDVRDGLD